MKKPFFVFCLAAMLLAVVPGCKKSDDASSTLQSVKISPTSLTMDYGKVQKLTYSFTPSDASVTSTVWSSTDTSVVTVAQDGNVTAVSLVPASTTVKVTLNGKISDSIRVEVTDKGYLTPEETIAYVDEAGQSALSQIVPQDFQNLAYIIKDGLTAYLGKGTFVKLTAEDSVQWDLQMAQWKVRQNSTGGDDYYFDGNLCGKADLTLGEESGTLTYDWYNHSETPLTFTVSSKKNYSGDLVMTCDEKDSIRLGEYGRRTYKNYHDTLYTYLPISLKSSISFDGKVYAKADLKTDFSGMAGMDLSLFEPLFDYGKLNFRFYDSDIYINGINSYRIRINNFSVADSKIADSLEVFGQNGESLLAYSGKSHIDDESSILPLLVSDGWKINLQKGTLVVNCTAEGIITVYVAEYAYPQMIIDLTDEENEKVTFADGTVKPFDEVFTAENFSQTVYAAVELLAEFIEIFKSTIF